VIGASRSDSGAQNPPGKTGAGRAFVQLSPARSGMERPEAPGAIANRPLGGRIARPSAARLVRGTRVLIAKGPCASGRSIGASQTHVTLTCDGWRRFQAEAIEGSRPEIAL
jgi:hypothetical protein